MRADGVIFPVGLSLADARSRIVEIAEKRKSPVEAVALESALGRVLAQDIYAPFDVPGFVNSAMDGYAVRGADLSIDAETQLHLIGTVLAGGADAPTILPRTCVRVTTGAPLPRGADTVVMKENTSVDGETIRFTPGTPIGTSVRAAGEDFRGGDLALVSGDVLTPARLGALASFGLAEVAVARRPRAILLTTGDELVAPGLALGFGQIHDSNRYSLGALLEQHGASLIRHERLRDDPAALRAALLRASTDADIVISSGGVSAGEADYLPGLLDEIGEVHFWKVRIKPGMPVLCGSIASTLICSLPANPASGIATFLTLVQPALDAMIGKRAQTISVRARLTSAIHKRHTRVEFLRARVDCDAAAILHATPLQKQGSGMLRGVAEANALIVTGEPAQDYPVGSIVEILPLPGWV